MPAALSDMLYVALSHFELAASRLAELESQKNRDVDHVSKL